MRENLGLELESELLTKWIRYGLNGSVKISMGDELYPILLTCGAGFAALLVVGFFTQLIAFRQVRHEFRAKGFLQVPVGWDLLNFLRRKNYELFSDSMARFFFTVAHVCMIGMLIIFAATILLCGSTLFLKVVSQAG